MTAPGPRRPRRQRGAAASVVITARIEDDLLTKIETAAGSLGLSKSAYLAQLIERDQVDATGRPVWGDEVRPREPQDVLMGLERAG